VPTFDGTLWEVGTATTLQSISAGGAQTDHMDRFIVISGCSGGGKSTILVELMRRGYAVVEEPGRRIIAEEAKGEGAALPWTNLTAFAQRAIDMALKDREAATRMEGWVFFDRGLIDAAAALEHATGQPAVDRLCRRNRYGRLVFMVPPWPEIYAADDARRHDLAAAVAEYERLLVIYSRLDYQIEVLPRIGVSQRADMIVQRLQSM
jgi:predicted ATPase